MMDLLREGFTLVQAWIFEQMVQPLMFQMGLMAYAEDAYEAIETVMIGAIEIGVLVALLKPLEVWRPVEQWIEKRAVRADVIYTWLNRLGVLPLLIFLLLVIPV